MTMRQRQSLIDIETGLHVLRYVSAARGSAGPVVNVAVAPGPTRGIEVISAPGYPPGIMSTVGDCLVIRSERPAKLQISVQSRMDGGSLDARFELETLMLTPVDLRPSAPVVALTDRASMGGSLRVLAHVSRRGDVWAESGEWIGGPDAPLPIEGIALHPNGQAGMGLECQVLTGIRQPRWSGWVPAGAFAGSRGKASPLLGLRLRCNGSHGAIRADALFLGAAIQSRAGREIELTGMSGREPLVGLALKLEEAAAGFAGMGAPAPARGAQPAGNGRVRVFRASSA
jgi:hypothetical protein